MARAAVFAYRSLIVLGVLLAAACGANSTSTADTSSAAATSAVVADTRSPLSEQLGFSTDDGVRQRELLLLQAQADQQVVACMAADGFQYVPQSAWAPVFSDDAASDGTREWAERNGLGIARAFEAARRTIDIGAAGDPNAAYLTALSPEQVAAYRRSLTGLLADGAAENSAYEPGGCQGAAFEVLFATYSVLEAFSAELDSMNARIDADPRVRGFMRDWSACMTARAFEYANQQAMRSDVFKRLLAVDSFTNESIPVDSTTGDLGALLVFERSVAVADHECSRSFQSGLAEIRTAYEQEFITDHRGRLDALDPAE